MNRAAMNTSGIYHEGMGLSARPELLEQAAACFRSQGSLVLKNVFDPALIEDLRTSFQDNYSLKRKELPAKHLQKVGSGRWMYSIRMQGAFCSRELLFSESVLAIMRELLGADCVIQSVNVVSSLAGAAGQHLHRDYPSLFPEVENLNAMLPHYAIHCAIPLVSLGGKAGTTAVWQGSHRNAPNPYEAFTSAELGQLKGATLPQMNTGDCYFMDARLRHCGTANHSENERPILYIIFCRPWFLDHANFSDQRALWLEPEDVENLSQDCLKLFQIPGYLDVPLGRGIANCQ